MSWRVDGDVEGILQFVQGPPTDLLAAMAEHGAERDFPIVGPEAGTVLSLLTRCIGAETVFEFGSGFGYSAAWFLQALPDHGTITLTDYDDDNLATARDFLERHPSGADITYAVGDAMETYRDHQGSPDVIFIDHDKRLYPDTLDLVAEDLADGGLIIADNILAGPVTPAGVMAALSGEIPNSEATAGIAGLLEGMRSRSTFRCTLLPIGNGLAVGLRTHESGALADH